MQKIYFVLSLFLAFHATSASAQALRTEKLAGKLLAKLAAEPDAYHSVNIVLTEQADLRRLDAQLSARRAKASERSEAVISALKSKSREAQAGLLAFLKNSGGVKPETVQSYWIANAVFAHANKTAIAELSNRDDVAWIGLNGKLAMEDVKTLPPPVPPLTPNGREPGLGVINAPALWAMGYTGYGQLAFTNDTGIDPTHPALESRYRGLYVPQEHTWFQFDPATMAQADSYQPFDCGSHGTHVNGTILGLDRLNHDTIGVAFNAQWVGSAILCGIGTEDNVAAFQWSLDPDGDPSTTEDMPDIINNSWYDPQLDTSDCFSIYVLVEEAMEAAGIAVIFSAGNAGPGDMSITPPHNINISEVSAFTVGALDGNGTALLIAGFSSRGPSACGGDSSILIKPEVSAPGVSVRSCTPGNSYDYFSGTSMASPHVSGAILLLKEAFPNLTGKELKTAIYHTCTDLGFPGEDNSYGMGVINVLAAFNYLVNAGHVPVSPYVANDILLVDMKLSPFSCEEEVLPLIFVENAGTDTIYSFEVAYDAGAQQQLWTWTGVLAPRERIQLDLPALASIAGTQTLTVRLANPNGLDDDRPLNNLLRRSIFVTQRERFQAGVAALSGTVCENTSALLRGTYTDPGTVEVNWYDTPVGGTPVGEGLVFATPPLQQSQNYYAEATYTVPLGLKDKTAGVSLLTDEQDEGIRFTVNANVRLKSVKVYSEASGARAIVVRNPANETVFQKIAFINQIGENKVNLGWDIAPGEYRLVKALGKPLYHNEDGASYPYEIEGVMAITGSTASQADSWYYFYDWEIEFTEPCDRTPVPVTVVPGSGAPAVGFAVSSDSIDLADSGVVEFYDNSADDVVSWHWDFGDGNSSELPNPVHTYAAPGSYVVSLVAASGEGCTAFALDTLLVVKTEVSGTSADAVAEDEVAVFPNPAGDRLAVYPQFSTFRPVVVSLVDLTGRVMRVVDFPFVKTDALEIDLSGLPAGIYLLSVATEGRHWLEKVVKM